MTGKQFLGRVLYHLGTLGAGLYIGWLGAQHHQEVKRIEHNLLYNDRKAAPGFFPDPLGLEIQYSFDDQGNVESYLLHTPSGKKFAIQSDMMPSSQHMLETILQREVEDNGNTN